MDKLDLALQTIFVYIADQFLDHTIIALYKIL
jgi:hypothetical protein